MSDPLVLSTSSVPKEPINSNAVLADPLECAICNASPLCREVLQDKLTNVMPLLIEQSADMPSLAKLHTADPALNMPQGAPPELLDDDKEEEKPH